MTDHDYFNLVTLTTIGCIAELVGIVYSTREWGDFRAWSYSLYKAMKKDIEISVQKFEMPRLGNDERHHAMGMLDGGMSCRQVAHHFGCSPSTITRLLQRHRETGSVNDRPRSGRERVTTPDQDRYIVLQHLRDRFLTASETAAATPGRHQPRISGNTVRRRLYESDLRARRPAMVTLLTPERRQNRLIWSRTHARWTQRNWNQVMFSDESRFCLSKPDGRERVWRRRGERYAECCVRQYNRWGGASAMVWAGISFNHKSPLVVINGNITARRYIDDVLDPVMVPFLNTNPDITVFQQDNARPHTARITREYMQQENVEVLPWSAYSPDLSPIEHLWDQLGRRLANRHPKPGNKQQLVAALQEEWANIPQDSIRRLIRSMRRRCTSCVQAQGGHIPY